MIQSGQKPATGRTTRLVPKIQENHAWGKPHYASFQQQNTRSRYLGPDETASGSDIQELLNLAHEEDASD